MDIASPLTLADETPSETDENALVDELANTGYLRAYVQWASDQTDAPRMFHLASGLAAIAAMLGNRVKCHSWGMDIYPNLWLCLLAPSGYYRKSTSIRYTNRLAKEVDSGILLAKDFSREQLVVLLGERPDVFYTNDEFGSLLGILKLEYMRGTAELITMLFDGEGYERSTRGGTASIVDPAITILTASTVDWISSNARESDLRGGLFARFLFLPARQKLDDKGICGLSALMRGDLVNGLRARRHYEGIADFRDVKGMLDNWIRQFEDATNAHPDPRMSGFVSRMGLYSLKLAMVFQAADRKDGDLEITAESAIKAMTLLDYVAKTCKTMVVDRIVTTRTEEALQKVIEALEQANGQPVTESKLLVSTRMFAQDLQRVLGTLVKSGRVELTMLDTGKRGPKAKAYRLVQAE